MVAFHCKPSASQPKTNPHQETGKYFLSDAIQISCNLNLPNMENFKNLSNMIQMLPGKRLVSQAVVEYMPATNVAEPRVKQQV